MQSNLSMYHFKHYADILKTELQLRQRANPSYSLRSFASKLEMSPSRLSEILNKKKGLSVTASKDICKKLKLNDKEKNYFLLLVASRSARSKQEKLAAENILTETWKNVSQTELTDNVFSILSEWYYFAILEFLKLKKTEHTPEAISAQMDISLKDAEMALERLVELKFIEKHGDKYISLDLALKTTDGIYSAAIRKYHQQIISKAMNSVELPVEERYLSALTVAVDKKLIPEINERIKKFRSEINQLITNHSENIEPDSIYCLSTQFFALTEEHPHE